MALTSILNGVGLDRVLATVEQKIASTAGIGIGGVGSCNILPGKIEDIIATLARIEYIVSEMDPDSPEFSKLQAAINSVTVAIG
jgi:hypothetical protein